MRGRFARAAASLLPALAFPALLTVGCAVPSPSANPYTQAPALDPAAARVWFLRQTDPISGNVLAAAPMVFANGAPVGRSPAGAVFYRDLRPATYTFTVKPYGGLPTGQAETLRLAAGTETYLQVEWLPSWQVGYPEATYSAAPNTFGIITIAPQVAEAYMPTMTYPGQP